MLVELELELEGAFEPEVERLALAIKNNDGADGDLGLVCGGRVTLGEPAWAIGSVPDAILVLRPEFAGEDDTIFFGKASALGAEKFGQRGIDGKGESDEVEPRFYWDDCGVGLDITHVIEISVLFGDAADHETTAGIEDGVGFTGATIAMGERHRAICSLLEVVSGEPPGLRVGDKNLVGLAKSGCGVECGGLIFGPQHAAQSRIGPDLIGITGLKEGGKILRELKGMGSSSGERDMIARAGAFANLEVMRVRVCAALKRFPPGRFDGCFRELKMEGGAVDAVDHSSLDGAAQHGGRQISVRPVELAAGASNALGGVAYRIGRGGGELRGKVGTDKNEKAEQRGA